MVSISFNKNKYVFTHVPVMLISSDEDIHEKKKEIASFLKELEEYNVVFKDLVNYPLEEEKRNLALNIAYYITENIDIQDKVIRKKSLPLKELSSAVRISQSNLDKLKDYIIAYYILISNLKYKFLQENLKIKLADDNKVVAIHNKKYPIEKGLVITSRRKNACILTSTGAFVKIKLKEYKSVGEIADGKESLRVNKYKIHISIFLVILTLISAGLIVQYNKVNRMVVVQLSSKIKLHVNRFNRVIYIYSPTERGQNLINKINVENEELDHALAIVFKEGLEEEMIDSSSKVLMTVTGKPLQYGELIETQKVIGENNIPIVINNVGNEQTLPKYENEIE